MSDPTKYDDIIDSRDVIEAAVDILDINGDTPKDATNAEIALINLDAEGRDMFGGAWDYGVTLIRYDYFREYAQELAEDLDLIPTRYKWPASHIDWDDAAEALRQDYSPVEFDGIEYWGRA